MFNKHAFRSSAFLLSPLCKYLIINRTIYIQAYSRTENIRRQTILRISWFRVLFYFWSTSGDKNIELFIRFAFVLSAKVFLVYRNIYVYHKTYIFKDISVKNNFTRRFLREDMEKYCMGYTVFKNDILQIYMWQVFYIHLSRCFEMRNNKIKRK